MRKILILSGIGFPPIRTAGSIRMLKLVKYLDKSGWKSIVFARKYHQKRFYDFELVKEIPENTIVNLIPFFFKILCGEARISKLLKFLLIDINFIWNITIFLKVKKAIKKHHPDIILVTSPPETSCYFGYYYSKLFNIPLIVDYRDPWTLNEYYWTPSKIHKNIENRLEKKIYNKSIKTLHVTQRIIDKYLFKYRIKKNKGNFYLLRNGYDDEDFKLIKSNLKKDKNRLIITHGGTLYQDYSLSFLECLKKVIKIKPEIEKYVKIIFYGGVNRKLKKQFKKYIDILNIKYLGEINYFESLKLLLQSDILLLTMSQKKSFDYIATSRLYNYLGSRKFIFATIRPTSTAAKIIKETNSGIVIDPKERKFIIKQIIQLFNIWKKNGKINNKSSFKLLNKYTRGNQISNFVSMLNKIVEEK